MLKIILYICIWIVGGNCPMKAETRTPLPDTFVRDILKTGIMKEIRLTQGFVALVDDEDYEYLNQWKWFSHLSRGIYYASRNKNENGRQTTIKMHREIMSLSGKMEIDHIDHNGLNNQKYNLRICTHSDNMKNRVGRGSSKYVGVSWFARTKKWKVAIGSPYTFLGYFDNEEDAAKRYDLFAKKRFGEFANLNFK